jgi:site-specific DNA recombinase
MSAGSLAGLRVGIYVRISDDQAGEGLGVARQEQDARQYATSRGGAVVKVYAENDTSAFKKRRVRQTDSQGRSHFVYRVLRPVYQTMLDDLRANELDAAVVYDLDRLARDPRDLEDAIEVVQHQGKRIEAVTGAVDLTTDSGIAMARVLVAMASKSSADTGRRVARKHQELAEAGVPVGGNRPFGWEDDKRTLRPVEAEAVRQAARMLMAGSGLAAVVRAWNAQGLTGTRGRPWVPQTVKQTMRNPRVAGLRSRHVQTRDPATGTVSVPMEVVHKDGQPVVGQWEPILSVEDWEAVCAVLGSNPTPGRGTNASKYLLTGIARCGLCGGPMRGTPTAKRNGRPLGGEGSFTYSCLTKSQGGCGGVARSGLNVDRQVTWALFNAADQEREHMGAGEQTDAAFPGAGRLAEIDRLISELQQAWTTGVVSATAFFPMLSGLEAEKATLVAERGRLVADAARKQAVTGDLRAEWDQKSLGERRAIIKELIVAVVIQPALIKGSYIYDPTRTDIIWQQ